MWTLITTLAFAHPCEEISLDEIVSGDAPSVVLLGERHGKSEDLKRALAVVKELKKQGPVTLALEAIHEKNQPVIDAYVSREFGTGKLPEKLDWKKTWGHAYKPYKKLLVLGRKGVRLVGAGLKLGPKPDDREVTIPEGYDEFLTEMMKGHDMSDEIRARFTTSMTWRDFRIAELSVQGWDRKSTLVILTGRGHLEGSMGSNWQVDKMVDVPTVSAILNHEGARCLPGDKVWK